MVWTPRSPPYDRCAINRTTWTRRCSLPSDSATPQADAFERAGPYLVRGSADLIPTARTLDANSPAIYCTTRNFAAIGPRVADALGGNGYSLSTASGGGVTGAPNPYVYPDNLPRLNAKGGAYTINP